MKIAVLAGSPRKVNTKAMVEAFTAGAEEAGHEVTVLNVGKMKIAGCLACNTVIRKVTESACRRMIWKKYILRCWIAMHSYWHHLYTISQ